MASSIIKMTKDYTSSWLGGTNGNVEAKRNGKIVTVRINVVNNNAITVQSSGFNDIETLPSNYRPNNINYFLGFDGKRKSNFPIKMRIESNGVIAFEVDPDITPIGTLVTPKATVTYILN